MTESAILREQARILRELATRAATAEIKELLLQCERLAQRFEPEHC